MADGEGAEMRTFVAALVLMGAVSAWGDAIRARGSFVAEHGGIFAGASVKSAEMVKSVNDYLRSKGTATWKFVLPVAEDSRVRFIDAVMSGGKFMQGTMYVFGQKGEKIDAKKFAALQKEFAMVGMRAGSDDREAALYPAGGTMMKVKTEAETKGIYLDASAYLMGALKAGVQSGGMKMSLRDLHYEISFEGPGGFAAVLGKDVVNQATAVAAMRGAIEAKWPKRKGMVSERDVRDTYQTGYVIYKPCAAGAVKGQK